MLRRDSNNAGSSGGSRYGAPAGGPAGKVGARGTAGLGPSRVGGPMTLLGGPKVRAAPRRDPARCEGRGDRFRKRTVFLSASLPPRLPRAARAPRRWEESSPFRSR